MKNDAIINGKVVILDEKEREAGADFHRKRYAFIWINGKLIFNNNKHDDRDHQHWVLEDFGISVDEWEKLNRGYMLPDRIQLFKGSKFEPINTSDISVTDFKKLLDTHKNKYNSENVKVYNGVQIGKVGEIWPPLMTIGEFQT